MTDPTGLPDSESNPEVDDARRAMVYIMGLPDLVRAGHDQAISTVLALAGPGAERVGALVERTNLSPGLANEVALLSAEEWDSAVNAFRVDPDSFFAWAKSFVHDAVFAVVTQSDGVVAPDDLSSLKDCS